MEVDNIDGIGKYYMLCSDDKCKSWCVIQFDKIIDYGISED